MTTFTISTSTDFSAEIISNLTLVDFINISTRQAAVATFSAVQFTNGMISPSLAIDGSIGRNGIAVNGNQVDGSAWMFTNWTIGDSVTFSGGAGNDLFKGTSQIDTIYGKAGADTFFGGIGADRLYGGDGNDTFQYVAIGDIATGEIIDGGAGVADRISLAANLSYNFLGASITAVEQLAFTNGGIANFSGNVVGAGGITTVIGSAGAESFNVSGQAIDLTGVTFNTWTDSADAIFLTADPNIGSVITGSTHIDHMSGGLGADTLNGGDGDDQIAGSPGVDTINGGNGNDVFVYVKTIHMEAGEMLDGGAGKDSLLLRASGTFDVSAITVHNVEALSFGMFSFGAIVGGGQIGAGAGLINAVSSSLGASHLIVTGSLTDLTGVTFTNWDALDTVVIQGNAATSDTLTGSSTVDSIIGGDLNDTIAGGGGDDTITGGLGSDFLTGGNQADVFVINATAESAAGASRDHIMDFSQGNDVIELANIDAITGGLDDAFTYIGSSAFSAEGQLRSFVNANGNTIVEGDVDGNGSADFQILLVGTFTLTAGDFIL